MHLSEHYKVVNEENATWTFDYPDAKNFTIYSARNKFTMVYLTFESLVESAQFMVQVTFPSQENHDHRLWVQSQAIPTINKRLSLDKQEEIAE